MKQLWFPALELAYKRMQSRGRCLLETSVGGWRRLSFSAVNDHFLRQSE